MAPPARSPLAPPFGKLLEYVALLLRLLAVFGGVAARMPKA